MPAVRPRHLFISHSWAYGDAYDKLIAMLDGATNLEYCDYSIPKDDPVHDADNTQELDDAIKDHMRPAQVILIMAGVYATYSKWIKREIEIVKSGFGAPKPIIAICPWGAEKLSTTVRDSADEIVGWNTNSVVNSIRACC